MPATATVTKIAPTPTEYFNQLIRDGVLDDREIESKINKRFNTPQGNAVTHDLVGMLLVGAPAAVIEPSEPKKLKKPQTKSDAVLQAEAALRRAKQKARDDEIEIEYIILLSETMTMHDAWEYGGTLRSLGKRNDKRLFNHVNSKEAIKAAFKNRVAFG